MSVGRNVAKCRVVRCESPAVALIACGAAGVELCHSHSRTLEVGVWASLEVSVQEAALLSLGVRRPRQVAKTAKAKIQPRQSKKTAKAAKAIR